MVLFFVRAARAVIVSLLGIWASLSTAHADFQENYWGNPLPGIINTKQKTAIASCMASYIGIPYWGGDSLYYKGYNFSDMSFTDATHAICRDKFGNELWIAHECVTYHDDGTPKDFHYGWCPSERLPACSGDNSPGSPSASNLTGTSESVGDPTLLPELALTEWATDWKSPKDDRFSVRRHYRSDQELLDRFAQHDVREGFAGFWRFGFDDTLHGGLVGLSANKLAWSNADGSLHMFDQTSFAAVGKGHGMRMRAAAQAGAGDLELVSRDGIVRVFTPSITDLYALSEIRWPDGYRIQFAYGTDGRVLEMTDNRGQKAVFSWTTSATPNFSGAVISQIEMDTDHDGQTFSPEARLTYSYLQNTILPFHPLLQKATFTDVASGSAATRYEYTYGIAAIAFPPKLKTIRDGRTDANGQAFAYTDFGYLVGYSGTWVTDVYWAQHFGSADKFSFGRPSALEVETTNALQKKTRYLYETFKGTRRIKTITGVATSSCLGTTRSFTYDGDGLIAMRTARNGSVTSFVRDAAGLIVQKTEDATGTSPRTTDYQIDSASGRVLTRSTASLLEGFSYDGDGLLTGYSQTDQLAGSPSLGQVRSWSYGYTTLASGLKVLTSVDGPGLAAQGVSDVTSYTYDAEGKLLTTTDPNGLVTSVQAYSVLGQPTVVRNPDTTEWVFAYDAQGRLVSSRFGPAGAPGPASGYAWDAAGQLISSTDTRGGTWSFSYNEARRLTRVTNPSGDRADYTYDLLGNVTRVAYSNGSAPAAFWQDSQFDALGRLLKTIGAMGQTWTYAHDVEDNLASVTDPVNAVETRSFDAFNRIVAAVDRENAAEAFAYDEADRQTAYTDPRSLVTSFTYNGFGDVVSETSPDRGQIGYTHDSRGLVATRTDARGVTAVYSYDNGGRVKKIDLPGSDLDTLFDYDIRTFSPSHGIDSMKGKLSQMRKGSSTTYTRFDYGYIPAATGDQMAVKLRYPADRTYTRYETLDTEGLVSILQYPSAHQFHYDRDGDGRITRIRLKVGKVYTTIVEAVSHLPNGPVASLRFGDGFTQTRAHDASYRLTGLRDAKDATVLRDVTYGYDAKDNPVSGTDALAAGNAESYGYSPADRLVSAQGPWGSLGWTHDGVGNRLSQVRDPGASSGTGAVTESYGYGATSNRLASVTAVPGGTRVFSHDAAGNVVLDDRGPGEVRGYGYDAAGRLASVSLNGAERARYLYDHLGQQIQRTLLPAGAVIHSVFDRDGHRIAEYDAGTGALIREYVWLDDLPVAVIEGTTTPTVYFVRADAIGRPVFATTSAGTVVWSASYLPFGEVRVSAGAPIDLRFPGQWFQLESGLHQNWMRDYDPTTGRYIEADPLGLIDGPGVYGYARQSPMMLTDPTGECPWCAAAAVAVGGAVLGYLLNQWADYLEDEAGCGPCTPLWNSDLLSALAGASAADGSAAAGPTRAKFSGATKGTSIQSSALRTLLPQRLPKPVYTPSARWPWPKTAGAGAAAGRWLPVAGYAMMGYDALRIIRCLTK